MVGEATVDGGNELRSVVLEEGGQTRDRHGREGESDQGVAGVSVALE